MQTLLDIDWHPHAYQCVVSDIQLSTSTSLTHTHLTSIRKSIAKRTSIVKCDLFSSRFSFRLFIALCRSLQLWAFQEEEKIDSQFLRASIVDVKQFTAKKKVKLVINFFILSFNLVILWNTEKFHRSCSVHRMEYVCLVYHSNEINTHQTKIEK